LVSVGGSGSNQIVAASVFSQRHGIPLEQYAFSEEGESFDNGLNMVSAMSFPAFFSKPPWSLSVLAQIRSFYAALRPPNGRRHFWAMPGGANVTGALGHVHAVLELAEQIESGHCDAPKHIFLALGSSCTTSGITAGLAVLRAIEPEHALNDTLLHPIGIHHATHSLPGHQMVRFAVRKLSRDVVALLSGWGVPDAAKELDGVYRRIRFCSDFAGQYGEWTEYGLLAKNVVAGGSLTDGADHPKPWMCSCFTSKAFAAMIESMETEAARDSHGEEEGVGEAGQYMFWCTKSAVQPLSDREAARENLEKMETEFESAWDWLRLCHINEEKDYLAEMSKL